MDFRMLFAGVFAIACSYLIVSMPLTLATDVAIRYGDREASAQLSPQNLVSKNIQMRYSESDPARTRVIMKAEAASLAHSIKRIYLYKCKNQDPTTCLNQVVPQSFDSWIDTELAWSDIYERAGPQAYPQVANILTLVKLEGPSNRTSWMSFWDRIERIASNVFDIKSNEISSIELSAKSADLVGPVQSYIANFQMIPFNWVSRAVFGPASVMYGGGANPSELNRPKPDFQTAQTGNQISAINREFYFVFPNISSGIANALTLNLNPSFDCGDGSCDAELGETPGNCCYDCGCITGSYCDISNGTAGSCKASNETRLTVTGFTAPAPLRQCTGPAAINVTARIDGAPSNLPGIMPARLSINSTQYAVQCSGAGGIYNCPLSIQPPVRCGFGSFSLGPNTLNMSISFRDGPNTIYRELSALFQDMGVGFDCSCQANFYCDAGRHACEPEGSIMLQIVSVDSLLRSFTGAGDRVNAALSIINAPTNFTANTFTFLFGNITWDANSVPAPAPAVNCISTGASGRTYNYNCSVPLTVSNYDNSKQYVIRGNTVRAAITYNDGGVSRQTTLSAPFGDIIIPQQSCGNGIADVRETQDNCCRDFRPECQSQAQYCDLQRGCQYAGNITASVLNVDPLNISDCTIPHPLSILLRVNNMPSDANILSKAYLRNGQVQPAPVQCSQPSYYTGLVSCQLMLSNISNCSLPYSVISGNALNLTIGFKNGDRAMLTKELSAPFGDIRVYPAWHCGDRVCESGIGESAANCCVDCPCKDSPAFGTGYYCNYDPQNMANGSCEQKSGIRVVIDRPTSKVTFRSCEYINYANIKAHLENAPAFYTLENFQGTLRGENAEVACVREGVAAGNQGNLTLNCTMFIPPEGECRSGTTYRYTNNSIGFFISFRDGLGRTVVQSQSARLPDFETTQSYRSLSQITSDSVNRIKQNLYRSLDISKKLLEWLKTCVYVQLALAVVEIGFTIAIGAGAFHKGGTKGWFGTRDWASSISAAGTVSQNINQIWGNICKMISEYLRMVSQMIQIENEIVKMEMCIEVYQHQLDSGACRSTGTTGCFTYMANCVDYGRVNSYMSSISSSVGSISGYSTGIGQSITNIGEGLDRLHLGSSGRATFEITWSGFQPNQPLIEGRYACNRYATYNPMSGFMPPQGTVNDALNVIIISGSGCEYPVVKYEGGVIAPASGNRAIPIDQVMDEATWDFQLYCFSDAERYLSNINRLTKSSDYFKDSKTVTIKVDRNMAGHCGIGPSASGSQTLSAPFLQQINSQIDGERARLNAQATTQSTTGKKASALSQLDEARNEINNAIRAGSTNDRISAAGRALDHIIRSRDDVREIGVPTSATDNKASITTNLGNIISSLQSALTQAVPSPPQTSAPQMGATPLITAESGTTAPEEPGETPVLA